MAILKEISKHLPPYVKAYCLDAIIYTLQLFNADFKTLILRIENSHNSVTQRKLLSDRENWSFATGLVIKLKYSGGRIRQKASLQKSLAPKLPLPFAQFEYEYLAKAIFWGNIN
jgi:hypothetical protein